MFDKKKLFDWFFIELIYSGSPFENSLIFFDSIIILFDVFLNVVESFFSGGKAFDFDWDFEAICLRFNYDVN